MEVFAYSGLSRLEFAERLKVSPAVLSHISSGRNQPSLDLILALRRAYPEISLDWMLLGTGSMKRSQTGPADSTIQPLAGETESVKPPSAPVDPPVVVQAEPVMRRETQEITDVKSEVNAVDTASGQIQQTILSLRIALQMHQQWMEQQLSILEKQLKGGE